ncbi:sigma-54-dependent Fis family transcriptional regulator [Desulfopila aestuarii]|uniref:Transcriptional regulator containing PAS, AAA-type ATPase, and DNA-binding Fis domains n=1 Tax=Desulfopila aestuarii DSM 18488 TaxID=1121416 RepID=A0A1M7YGR3_9BACT|nr:sigma 54-interacting transcriptional regulator [Desulfopila aestuarii]SHO51810.1 Transcriptional regulator containing PAS, AAA-type ATPase, and DNA-binding Fis domains [Desulfopila aestuarii DSM 18488]
MVDNTAKRKIAEQWSRFCTDGSADPALVRDFILASWRRSRNFRVDPEKVQPHRVEAQQLETILADHSHLVRISFPVIENLYGLIKGSRSIIILSDENGIILSRTGDPDYLSNSKAYEPGIEYSERTVGTNGIGTSLYLDSPVQIWAEEHFARRNHELSCSAAPIHDPGGKVIGCLNLSCLWNSVHTHTLGMVMAAAASIEQQLRIEAELANKVALLQEKQVIFELIQDGLLTVDRRLLITDINDKARRMLGIGAELGCGRPVYDFVLAGLDFEALVASAKSIHDQDVTLRLEGGVVNCTLSATPVSTSGGLVITLREAKSVRRMVNRYAGAKAVFTFDDIIGASPQIREAIRLAKIAGQSNTNTLILGESGTGKEMFAQAIHNGSDRRKGPFVAINCGALPRELIQSELFGYAEGAFTGARRQGNPGKFELADGGTIFLDEIGEMPLADQVNLLRVVENKEVVRVGDSYSRPVDVRVIAATNSRLTQAIAEKTFREDLYYRLNVMTINLPPLRLRAGDIEVLLNYFLDKVCHAIGSKRPQLDNEAYLAITRYSWPGNIRELENVIERAVHIQQGGIVRRADLGRDIGVAGGREESLATSQVPQYPDRPRTSAAVTASRSLRDSEYSMIMDVLRTTDGNIRRSAELLGVARSTLYEKLRKFEIELTDLRRGDRNWR